MMSNSKQEKKWWEKVMNSIGNWMAHKKKDEWLKDMRGNLSLLATVIATMTFQSAINPPGGIRPASETGEITCPDIQAKTLRFHALEKLSYLFLKQTPTTASFIVTQYVLLHL